MPKDLGSAVGFLGRIKGSIKGIATGFFIFLLAFPLLFWNEGRAVKTAKSLAEGASSVVSVSEEKVDSANDQALVHVTGKAVPTSTLADSLFAIEEEAIQLERTVEMRQWQENENHSDDDGSDKVTYSYEQVWSSEWIDSSKFHEQVGHENPSSMPIQSNAQVAEEVTLGAFKLNESQIVRVPGRDSLSLDQSALDRLSNSLKEFVSIEGGDFLVTAANMPAFVQAMNGKDVGDATKDDAPDDLAIDDEQEDESQPEKTEQEKEVDDLIAGLDDDSSTDTTENVTGQEEGQETQSDLESSNDESESELPSHSIGDMRIHFSIIRPKTISVIAKQDGESFAPYSTKAGRDLDMLRSGEQSAGKMFQDAISANKTMTWIIRAVGFIVMAIGAFLILRPLSVVADMVPFVGGILQMGVVLIALLVAVPFTLGTIGIAWVFYRPLLGISLLVIGLGILVATFFLAKSLSKNKQVADQSFQP